MAPHAEYTSSDQEPWSSETDYSDQNESLPNDACIPEETISIVGMGCRWPGRVSTPSQLWDLLANGKSGYKDFDDSKLNLPGFYHPNPQRPGSTPARGAYQLQEDPKVFDHAFFGINPTEVLTLDPQHRKLLEVVYEAFENAGEPWEKFSGSRTGVFVGNFTADHNIMQTRDIDNLLPYATTGGSTSILSNRINYIFNLQGPSLTLDTACSSSLYALHLAANAIKNGDCDSAIVGAGNLILGPDLHLSLSKLGALSPSTTCHVFDTAADGYARGEGFAAFYLKRTSDAVAGAYPIRSVIRGTAINSNGRTAGITHPSIEGQVEVIRMAYANAKLDPSMTGYFEAHGTGTQVGDPTEVSAIGQVFSKSYRNSELRIGSIKSNIGHTEAASGLAGLMKSILAMEHGFIPPTIGISELNPKIDFRAARVRPVTRLERWPAGRLKRVSINSFGYGGANGHCILDHVSVALPGYDREASRKLSYTTGIWNRSHEFNARRGSLARRNSRSMYTQQAKTRRMVILPFSAKEDEALKNNMHAISTRLQDYDSADIAYTLSQRRSKFKHRTYRILESMHSKASFDLRTSNSSKPCTGRKPRIGLVFTGQGAQWDGMGADLLDYAVFRNAVEDQDRVLASLSNAPSWTISDVISGKLKGRLHEPLVSQTVCTALQVAMVDLLRAWGMEWSASIGHSSGEIAAAYAAGIITAPEAIVIAYCRGLAVASNKRSGLMLAVGLGHDDVEPYLENFRFSIKIAAINSSESVTLSGDTFSVMELYEVLLAKGLFAKLLQTGRNAYHSHHMAAIGETYVDLLDKALGELKSDARFSSSNRLTKVDWFSSATPDKPSTRATIDAMYWRWNLQAPVQFSRAVENMMNSSTASVDVLVEMGPHSALKSPLRQILSSMGKDFSYLSTLRRHEDGMRNILSLCGDLFCMDASIDLAIVNSTDAIDEYGNLGYQLGTTCVDLPKYAYNYGPIIYHENRLSKEIRHRQYLKHDILGSKQLGCSKYRPSWRNVLKVKDVPWLAHHRLAPQTVFPASAYICMAIEAATQFFENGDRSNTPVGFTIRNLSLKAALVIPESDSGAEIVLDLDASKAAQMKGKPTWYNFKISCIANGTDIWTEHCSGIILPHTERKAPASKSYEIDRRVISSAKWYKKFSEMCLEYGDSFQGLSELTSDPTQNIAQGKVALETTSNLFNGPESSYIIHPAALDMCAQLALIAAHGGQVEQMSTAYVPSFVGEMSIWTTTAVKHSFGTATATGALHGLRGAHAQAQLVNDLGEVMLDISDIRCTAYSGSQKEVASKASPSPYSRLIWKPYLESLTAEQARSMFPPTELPAESQNMFSGVDLLGALMVAEISERFQTCGVSDSKPDEFQKFLSWAGRMAHMEVPEANEAAKMSSTERIRQIDDLCASLSEVVEVPISKRIFDNLEDIFSGEKSSLELIRQDDAHSQMYDSGLGISASYTQLERVLDLLSHENPSMNILEIGAGTGGATRVALKTLSGDSYLHRYRTYTFTDVSSGYFPEARKEFSSCQGVEFGVLDIEKAPKSQGFEPIYDLVIASCSIHVTKDINLTLSNARSLLKPGGKFLILECTQPKTMHGLVLGTLPDYWVGTEEARRDSPFLPVGEWRNMLGTAGFSGIDIELDDYPQPYTMISTILSSAVETQDSHTIVNKPSLVRSGASVHVVSLLGSQPIFNAGDLFLHDSTGSNFILHDGIDRLPDQGRVIALYDASSSPTENETQYEAIKNLLSTSRSVLWVNIDQESANSYSYSGAMAGLLRVLAAENPSSSYASINVSKANLSNNGLINQILDLEQSLSMEGSTPKNVEYQVRNGAISISRLISDKLLNDHTLQTKSSELQLLPLGGQPPLAATFATPGILSSLYFAEDKSFWKPLQNDEIEVQTRAVGLNWKDLAVSAGRLDLDNFSSECSGIVTKIGKDVTRFQVGEKVFGVSKGKFGNFMRCKSALMQHMFDDNYVKAAARPIVYMTALYALSHLARIEEGEKVLIQSASGGLGIAALDLALHFGADIWVTVGTEEKRVFLRDTYGIPDAQILSSRRTPCIEDVQKATGGTGFDVILSTCSGDSLGEWARCLARAGRMIDVGRVDVQNHASMALEVFKRNATFSSFDLGILIDDKPALCGRLLEKAADMLRSGSLRQGPPIKTFDIGQLAPALLYLSKGVHIGKVVITYDDPASLVNMIQPDSRVRFDPEAKYLLVGGLGGLGRSIMTWMTERGAQKFVALSRQAPGSTTEPFLANLSAHGCSFEHICCDVSRLSDVQNAVTQASQSGTINGIIHTAVSLKDKLFDSLSFSEWQQGLKVKVDGSINLHKASLHLPLDHFILVSSNSAQIALPTQATYCASNNFQNEFARYRRNLGLPATAVELGLIEEAGDLGQNPVYHNATMRSGLYHTSEHGFLEHLDHVFGKSSPGSKVPRRAQYDTSAGAHLITSLDPTELHNAAIAQRETTLSEGSAEPRWQSDMRFLHITQAMKNLAVLDEDATRQPRAQAPSKQDTHAALAETDELVKSGDIAAATTLATASIMARMADMLFISADGIDPTKGVAAYGMDSLIAAELRNWFLGTYKCKISFLKLLDTATSIKELAGIVIESRLEAHKA